MKNRHIHRLLLVAGVIWLAIGATAFFFSEITYWVLVKYSGFALLLDGLLLLALSQLDDRSRQKKWRIAESIVDITFSTLLLMDPILSLFAFSFVISPWMAVKGTIKMLGSQRVMPKQRRLNGDLFGGMLLLLAATLIPHNPMERSASIDLLIGILGCTLGLIYLYDFYKEEHSVAKLI